MNSGSSAEGAGSRDGPLRLHAGLGAVRHDARRSAPPGEGYAFTPRIRGLVDILRFCWSSDEFLGTVLYRLRVSLRNRGVPVLPLLLNRLCSAAFRIRIGDEVKIGQGMHVLHGNVSIEGSARIGTNVTIAPWVSISGGSRSGASIVLGDDVFIGTGSSIRGPVVIGDRAVIGARTAVTNDVGSDATVVGSGIVSRRSGAPSHVEPVEPSSEDLIGLRPYARWTHKDHPPLGLALRADGLMFAANAGHTNESPSRRSEWKNVAQHLLRSRSYDAVALYRLRTAFRAHRLPLLPTIVNKLNVTLFNVRIGKDVRIAPGFCIPRGHIVIDGVASIDTGCVIGPSSTIGLQRGLHYGPRIESYVTIGANSAVLGDIRVGRGAQIRPGSAVVREVEDDAIVGGVPARVVAEGPDDTGARD